MSKVSITRSLLDDLATSISAKSGEPVPMTLAEMKDAVDDIQTGGTLITKSITQNGIYDAEDDNADGYSSVNVSVSAPAPTLQSKTYNVSSAGTATVTADNGYDGLSSVNVSVPSANFFVGAMDGEEFYTENGVRKWRYRSNVEIDPNEGDSAGWIDEGVYYSEYNTRNAVPSNTSVTPTESSQTIGGANYMMEGAVTVNAIPSNYVGSGITQRSSSDLTASGATVTVPSGYYSAQASKAVASGTAGTPTATKGSVSNHSISVTPSVTNTSGYITGGTINGTAVTVSASELVSGSDTVTTNDTYDVTNLAELVVAVSSGGVTVTDEANATGTTCVITTGSAPSEDIPLNTQLIDFTKTTNDYVVNSSGNVVAEQWYSVSDYTEIDPSMTFSYSGCYWFYIGFYDASKNTIRALSMNSDGTQRPNDTNYCDGTLTPAKMPSNAKYVRITSTYNPDSTILSLIRTA